MTALANLIAMSQHAGVLSVTPLKRCSPIAGEVSLVLVPTEACFVFAQEAPLFPGSCRSMWWRRSTGKGPTSSPPPMLHVCTSWCLLSLARMLVQKRLLPI